MAEIIVKLSLPPPGCSANPRSKANYKGKSKAVALHRQEACTLGRLAKPVGHVPQPIVIHQEWFFGKTRAEERVGRSLYYRPRDVQNAIIALKGAVDGLVDAGIVPEDSFKWVQWGKCVFYTAKERPGLSGIVLWLELWEAESGN